MASIVFDNVAKHYGDAFVAIPGLNIDIRDREFLVLVGPSGCGKSTALRMIAGLEDISSGRLLIDGELANHLAPRDRDIAMVFQSYALYPHLSVEENIGFGLRVRGAGKAEIATKVRETARLLELGDLLGRKPGQLSGGQRQRVAMGRALVRRPKAFLMDEPLSNLDARLRGHMRSEIARLQKLTGVTTVYVTHDQVEAMTMGDRVALLRLGVLQQLGVPRELYDNPANMFVAGFIGAPSMNFLRARLALDDGGMRVEIGSFRMPISAEVLAVRPRLAAYAGQTVMLGIRPEALKPVSLASTTEGVLRGAASFIEDLGATRLAHLDIEAASSLAELPTESDDIALMSPRLKVSFDAAYPVVRNELMGVTFDLARAHVFDMETELAIRD